MKQAIVVASCVFVLLQASGHAADPLLLAQQPALSASQIAFVYAGDLWTVPREVAEAQAADERRRRRDQVRRSRPMAPRSRSPANTTATSTSTPCRRRAACRSGSRGIPRRTPCSAGRRTARRSCSRPIARSYARVRAAVHDGRQSAAFPRSVPLPWGWEGAYLAGRQRWRTCRCAARSTCGSGTAAATRRRSGSPRSSNSRIEKVPRENSNDYNPMWIGDKVYFLSDRNGPSSLFSYDTQSRQVKQEKAATGLRLQVGVGRSRRHRRRAVRRTQLFDVKSGALSPVSVKSRVTCPKCARRW